MSLFRSPLRADVLAVTVLVFGFVTCADAQSLTASPALMAEAAPLADAALAMPAMVAETAAAGDVHEAAVVPETITVPVGSALFLKTTYTVDMKRGAMVEGVLLKPLYIYDRQVLPAGAVLRGTVSDLEPLHGTVRAQALLNGDVTPLRTPVLRFDHVLTPSGEVSLVATGLPREVKPVKFVVAGERPGLFAQAGTALHDKINDTKAFFGPGFGEHLTKMVYSQMPYHPQRVWSGTTFIADVTEEAELPGVGTARIEMAPQEKDMLQNVRVQARLATALSSDTSARGDVVTAVLTQPLFNKDHELLLPEGTKLQGSVMKVQKSRSFGRTGQLRFLFQTVERPGESAQKAYGLVKSAEGEGAENLTLDAEGGVKANPEGGRFLAPIVLGVLTAAGAHGRHEGTLHAAMRQTVASNGFGFVARVVSVATTDTNVATGFGAYAFAKSIYFRFLAKGQPVSFGKDTPLEVELQTR
jgi:hypothetical protein